MLIILWPTTVTDNKDRKESKLSVKILKNNNVNALCSTSFFIQNSIYTGFNLKLESVKTYFTTCKN